MGAQVFYVPHGSHLRLRVTALNAGGESVPSVAVGCRTAKRATAPRVLFVDGFTKFDRFNHARQTLRLRGTHSAPGPQAIAKSGAE